MAEEFKFTDMDEASIGQVHPIPVQLVNMT